MVELLGLLAAGLLVPHLAVVIMNALFPPMLRAAPEPAGTPFVSVLIPARNEAHNIRGCVAAFEAQDYERMEIIVLDDHSTDGTAQVLRDHIAGRHAMRVIQGAALPKDWFGKAWACAQLSEEAQGEILIFADADTRPAPAAVRQTVGWMTGRKLWLLSAFPQQRVVTLGEKLVIPAVDMILYGYLWLWLTLLSKSERFAAANGQWLALTRRAYDAVGGHAAVRTEIVEDVAFSRLVKRCGGRMLTVSGRDSVVTRMYSNWRETWLGFSKNLFGLTGHRLPVFAGFALLLACNHILPYALVIASGFAAWSLAIALAAMAARFILAVRFGHPVFVSTILDPVSTAALLLTACNSVRWYYAGATRWKGRRLAVRNTHNTAFRATTDERGDT